MSISPVRYHDIYCIRDILFGYLEERERRDVQSLFNPENPIYSLLDVDIHKIRNLVVDAMIGYHSRCEAFRDPYLRMQCAQDIIKRSISKFYDGLIVPSSLSISLLMSTEGGYEGRGDLSFMIKLARGLIRWGSQVSIVTNETESAKKLLKDVPCVILNTSPPKPAIAFLLKSNLVIEAPISSPNLEGIRKGLKGHNFIQIGEYGLSVINQMQEAEETVEEMGLSALQRQFNCPPVNIKSALSKFNNEASGPDHGELGIFVNQGLYEKSRYFARQANNLGSSKALQQGVNTLVCPCLKKALSSALVNNPILYFGYGDEGYEYFFAEVIAQLESRDKGPRPVILCIVERLSNLTTTFSSTFSELPSISSKLPLCLKRLWMQKKLEGFSAIQFFHVIPREVYAQVLQGREPVSEGSYTLPAKGTVAKTIYSKGSQKQAKDLTVVSIPYLCTEDMHTMQALADLILSTGDGSTDEAISADKIWLYALPTHKRGFINAVVRRTIEINANRCFALLSTFIKKDTEGVITALQDRPFLLKQFKKLNYVLRKTDLLHEVTYLVQRKIVESQNPQVAKAAANLTDVLVKHIVQKKRFPFEKTSRYFSELYNSLAILRPV